MPRVEWCGFMPVEIICEFGTPGASRVRISAEAQLLIREILRACGTPPPEMELAVQWQEHELGSYPAIVLSWEDGARAAPWNYIGECQDVLDEMEND